jgi:hypothetical protein
MTIRKPLTRPMMKLLGWYKVRKTLKFRGVADECSDCWDGKAESFVLPCNEEQGTELRRDRQPAPGE